MDNSSYDKNKKYGIVQLNLEGSYSKWDWQYFARSKCDKLVIHKINEFIMINNIQHPKHYKKKIAIARR